MKTADTCIKQVSPERSTKIDLESVQDSASSKTERPTSKTRNFGWLVTGTVEACQQVNIDDAI